MKKLLTGILSLALLAAMTVPAQASDSDLLIAPAPDASAATTEKTTLAGYAIEINGENSGARAYVMVLLRTVAEKLGFTVTPEGNTVKISTDTQSGTQRPNPYVDYESLADVAKAAGFSLSVSDKLDRYPHRIIQTMDDELIQVIYQNDDGFVFIRKPAGKGDISGDYNQYVHSKTVDVNSSAVTMKGMDGLAMVAIQVRDGYTYAITADAGMSADVMTTLVQAVR